MQEFSWLMEQAPDQGIAIRLDADAMAERVSEWAATPEGTLLGFPGWGNPFFAIKHDPENVNLVVMAEMMLVEKLNRDIRGLNVQGVSISYSDIDTLTISLLIAGQYMEASVRL